MKRMIIELPPNRVRRSYKGGLQLDEFAGNPNPSDTDCPEDWIASTILARNPGMPEIENEGLAHVTTHDGETLLLRDLFEQFPEHYLGKAHYQELGSQLGFLAKLLDASMRLHVQAHPTSQFAQAHLGSRWGKLETYVILSVRDDCEGHLRLGFQNLKDIKNWNRIVFEQDIPAMDACFERIPVKAGEVWLVPGGVPHAIGEGLLVLEVMEPSDLVVRCEFEREGIVVPPEGRFMGRDPAFAMTIFDHTNYSAEEIAEKCRIVPTMLHECPTHSVESLIGPNHTDCFEIDRWTCRDLSRLTKDDSLHLCVVAEGKGTVTVQDESIDLKQGSCFLIPSAANEITISPRDVEHLTVLACKPGTAKLTE
ncbi:class I mannose-6-phosphate isomerase [Adhaeretor mobilis]|uniref:Phosphohexomutase n=1 Tax=Adhaeretor mobilis TaxID=1930276 RepID=A0A517MYJ7_9BACT|nr:mannose-6-phosphate isomerase [Adhaeretor mobilis]QDS99939.1 putative mannose-6-phosphate isomerase GmuF [Adhaeretor mobilis]